MLGIQLCFIPKILLSSDVPEICKPWKVSGEVQHWEAHHEVHQLLVEEQAVLKPCTRDHKEEGIIHLSPSLF